MSGYWSILTLRRVKVWARCLGKGQVTAAIGQGRQAPCTAGFPSALRPVWLLLPGLGRRETGVDEGRVGAQLWRRHRCECRARPGASGFVALGDLP